MEERLRGRALVRLGEMAAVIAHGSESARGGAWAIQVISNRLPRGRRETDVMTTSSPASTAQQPGEGPAALPVRRRPIDAARRRSSSARRRASADGRAGVHVAIAGNVPPVMADAELLKIVFINLFVNSAQAMKGRGR
jgi:hypothetical protein